MALCRFPSFLLTIIAACTATATTARPPVSRYAIAGAVADAPNGFVQMCARDLTLCAAGNAIDSNGLATTLISSPFASPGNAAPHAPLAGGDSLRLLRKVNGEVNMVVSQRSDISTSGTSELWRRPGSVRGAQGDCEDLAIEKRMRLIELGFPADRLFFAIAYKHGLGLHTVLGAHMPDADYVLDSAKSRIVRWDETDYRWLRFQTPGQPLVWTRALDAVPAATALEIAGTAPLINARPG